MCQDDNQPFEVPLEITVEPDGSYTVTCPYLPEMKSRGKTREQAMVQANYDLPSILNRYEREGKPLPPQFR